MDGACTWKQKKVSGVKVDPAYFIITYLFSLISGILMLLLYGSLDRRLKLHSLQAIMLGIVSVVAASLFGVIFPILRMLLGTLVWVYGMYIGLEAYAGTDIDIPIISDFAHSLL